MKLFTPNTPNRVVPQPTFYTFYTYNTLDTFNTLAYLLT